MARFQSKRFRTAGIYGIWNHRNDRMYVGQTGAMYFRLPQHYNDLQRGAHHNKALQRDWNRYGPSAFEWLVLCPVHDERTKKPLSLRELETIFIRVYQSHLPKFGYNIYGSRYASPESEPQP